MADVVAVVLARGLGSRMRREAGNAALTPEQAAAAGAGLKALMPMAGSSGARPFLDYVLSSLADAGFRTAGLVVGPEHDVLRDRYSGTHAPVRLAITFVTQQQPLGTADAVVASEPFVAGRPFVTLNADNLYPVQVLEALRHLDGPGLPAFERDELVESSDIPPDRVGAFALLDVGGDGTLEDIVEKPGVERLTAAGPHALVSMNCWRFDEQIFGACRDVPRSSRGEFELPEAVRLAVRRGIRFRVVPARGPVLDLSRRDDVPRVAARLSRIDVRL